MSGGYNSIFNASSRTSDADVQSYLPDLNAQTSGEFWWYWGNAPYVDQNGGGTPIILVDYPGANDPQGALGYHWVDQYDNPYAVIFVGLCQDYGYSVSGVISHELLEMAADQLAITTALWDFGDGTGIIIINEVCDPCEQVLYAGAVNGNAVSDFVTPQWFSPIGSWPYDALGVIATPLTLVAGGSYISYQYVTLSGWQQAFADKADGVTKAAAALRARLQPNPHQTTVEKLRQQQPVSATASQQQGQRSTTNGGNNIGPKVLSRAEIPEHLKQAQQQAATARATSAPAQVRQQQPQGARLQQVPPHLQAAMAQAKQAQGQPTTAAQGSPTTGTGSGPRVQALPQSDS